MFGEGVRSPITNAEVPSPIRITRLTPRKSGTGVFDLECFQPNNPYGKAVQIYRLQTIDRSKKSTLVRTLEHEADCFIFFSELTESWMSYHFPEFDNAEGLFQSLESSFRKTPDELSSLLSTGSEALSRKLAHHWSNDRFWTDAKDQFSELRRVGKFSLDLNVIQERIFAGDSAAYKLMEAMTSVWQREEWDGYKGAPRVLLLLLARLAEQCSNAETNDPDSDRS